MSTRDDVRLTSQERAALSYLESLASADDPQLAARLRGPGRWSFAVYRDHLATLVGRAHIPDWARSLWFAVPVVAIGLALILVGLSVSGGLGVCGALLAAGGLTSIVRHAGARLGPGRGPAG